MYKYLLNPKNWLIIIVYGLIRLLILLPYPVLMKLGTLIGVLMYHLLRKGRKTIEINIKLCFPHLSLKEQQKLVKKNMISYGKGLFETTLSWWAPDKKIANLYTINGLQDGYNAAKNSRGIILLCAHFTMLELTGRMLSMQVKIPGHAMYRKFKNPLLNHLINKNREKYCNNMISNKNVAGIFKSLANNHGVWYAPDENCRNNMVFVPFFGVPAATTTATSRIAKISGSKVIPFFVYRKENDKGYVLNILPALDNFPSGDEYQDTFRINKLIEDAVKQHPDQYIWMRRRFRTRPQGEPDIYPKGV
jgi:KDO2-lipid IV(A) lauroyltransferase